MATLDLSPAVFSILSGFIEEKVGLHYGLSDREILQVKTSGRAQEAGFESILDYYYFLRYDDGGEQELTKLVENLVVGETYFFREWPAIRTLVDSFIAPWCAAGRRPRIWSAACASGEEPLSIAMLLDDRDLLDQVDIVASDINQKSLAKAKAGIYSKRAVRQVPEPKLLQKYIRSEGDQHIADSRLIDKIHWTQVNLLSDEDFKRLGVFDVILCRNVLIYFSDTTVKSVLNRFSSALKDDGAFFVGVSESLLRYGNTFIGEERDGAFVYRKAVKT